MKQKILYLLLIMILLSLSSPLLADEIAGCHATANTQAEMNVCAGNDIATAQRELEEVLARIRARHADDPKKTKKIERAQKAWEDYMQAQIDLLYFDHAGSTAPMCAADDMAYFINLRAQQLRMWVDGNVEGNVCGGL